MNVEEITKAINLRLKTLVAEENVSYNPLFQAARYSLLSSGKRLRPLITLAILQDYSLPSCVGLDAACSLELIHTYSLIHDDLPCIDDDDIRRNQPSLHKAFNEGLALLAGDYLLTYAFEVLSQDLSICDTTRIKLIYHLSSLAGAKGMIGGQVSDIFFKNTAPKDTIDLIHQGKTGALFEAAFLFGGIIAKTPEAELSLLRSIGVLFGKSFQYMDDFQDFSAQKQEVVNIVMYLGKEQTLKQIELMQSQISIYFKQLTKPLPLLAKIVTENFSNFYNQVGFVAT